MKRKALRRQIDESYKSKANRQRGRPDYSLTDPADDEIAYAKYQLDQISLRRAVVRSWIAMAIAIIGVAVAAIL